MILRSPMKSPVSFLLACLVAGALPASLWAQAPVAPGAKAPDPAAEARAAAEAAAEARAERLEQLRTAEREASEVLSEQPQSASAALSQALEAFGRGEPFGAEWSLDQGLERLSQANDPRNEQDRALLEFARGALLAEHAADWLGEFDPQTSDPIDIELAIEREARAVEAFEAALALAGSNAIGRRAAYDLGALYCRTSERLFLGVMAQVAGPDEQPSPPDLSEGSPERQALEAAAAGFVRAREALIDRLRLDSDHADTRANLQWAQLRLREIERLLETDPPEEQEQEQEDQDQQQDEQEQSEEQDQEQEEQEDSESEESDESESESEEEGEESEPNDEESEGDSEQESPESEQESEQQTEQTPEEGGESEEQQAAEVSEEELSKEEMARLLDRLEEIEAARDALRAELARNRRVPVERDW